MKSDKENLSVDERIGQNLKAYRKLIGLERKKWQRLFILRMMRCIGLKKDKMG